MKYIALLIACMVISGPALSMHDGDDPLSADDWKDVMEKVALLEDSGLMPTLLPTIMRNRDALQLTDKQVSAFLGWRKKNYTNMVNIMNEIIQNKVQFRIESLSTRATANQLLALQAEIHDQQRQLLEIKLSCRELIMTTFTDEQWENFAFVVADNPKLASLLSQVNTIGQKRAH
ncbi:MAG: hypothetical protein PVI91_09515 [Gammaproteobacteria bacterium]